MRRKCECGNYHIDPDSTEDDIVERTRELKDGLEEVFSRLSVQPNEIGFLFGSILHSYSKGLHEENPNRALRDSDPAYQLVKAIMYQEALSYDFGALDADDQLEMLGNLCLHQGYILHGMMGENKKQAEEGMNEKLRNLFTERTEE